MDALEKAGFTPGYVTKLQQFKELPMLLAVLAGKAQIVITKRVIDCDVDPFAPEGWTVEEHIKGSQLEWDPSCVELYLDKEQQNGKTIVGNKLRKTLSKLAGKKVTNACVLDFLLAYTELIPEEWKGKAVFFWDTIYRNSDGLLCARCLYWSGGGWYWCCHRLDDGFDGGHPAAVRK